MLEFINTITNFIVNSHLSVGASLHPYIGDYCLHFIFGTEFALISFTLWSIIYYFNNSRVIHPDVIEQVIREFKNNMTKEKLDHFQKLVDYKVANGLEENIDLLFLQLKPVVHTSKVITPGGEPWLLTIQTQTEIYTPKPHGYLYDFFEGLFQCHTIGTKIFRIVSSAANEDIFQYLLFTAQSAENYVITSALATCALILSVITVKLGLNSVTALTTLGLMITSFTSFFIFDKLIAPLLTYYNVCPKLMFKYKMFKLINFHYMYANFIWNYTKIYVYKDFTALYLLLNRYYEFFRQLNVIVGWCGVSVEDRPMRYISRFQEVRHLVEERTFQGAITQLIDHHATRLANERYPENLREINETEAYRLGHTEAKWRRLFEGAKEHLHNDPIAFEILRNNGVISEDGNTLLFDNVDIPIGTNIIFQIIGPTDIPTTEKIVTHFTCIRDDAFVRRRMHTSMAADSRENLPNNLFMAAKTQLTEFFNNNSALPHSLKDKRIPQLLPGINEALGNQVVNLRILDINNQNNNNSRNSNNNNNNTGNVNNQNITTENVEVNVNTTENVETSVNTTENVETNTNTTENVETTNVENNNEQTNNNLETNNLENNNLENNNVENDYNTSNNENQ